jgi:hypothetical protein
MGIKGHYSGFIVFFPIPIFEGKVALINGDDPII